MTYRVILITVSAFLFLGCAEKQTIDVEAKPQYQVQKQMTPSVSNKGSLFTRKGPSLFADKKDLQIGDIIKVNIEIEDIIESGVTRNSDSTSSSDRGIGTFTGNGSTADTARRLNSAVGIGFNVESSQDFDATAESSTTDRITDSFISAVVQEVYQNGNYFIQGNRETLILGQKLTVKVSGVIRPYDIQTSDNSVDSEKIANLKILYEKDGEEVDIIKKKWGTKLIDTIWPF